MQIPEEYWNIISNKVYCIERLPTQLQECFWQEIVLRTVLVSGGSVSNSQLGIFFIGNATSPNIFKSENVVLAQPG
jgi:hypothetical protein